MNKLILFSLIFYSDLALSQADPLRNVYIASRLDQVSEELRMQAAENEYWVFNKEDFEDFSSLSLGDFLKFKMPINQGGSFEDSYVNKASINQAFGFSQKYTAIVLNDSRLSLSDVSMLNLIYNLPLSHISRIEYTPSMEAFKFQTGASSGVLHIRTKKDNGAAVSFARSINGSSNQVQAAFSESIKTDSGLQNFSLSLYERARVDYSQNQNLEVAKDRYVSPASSGVDKLEVSEADCLAASGQVFENSECLFRLGSRQSYLPRRQGGLMHYSYKGVLSGVFLKSSLYLGMQREVSKNAYPRAVYLKADDSQEVPLVNISGDKQSLFLWRANSSSSSEEENKTYYSQLDTSLSYELSNASDIGLNLSFLYNKYEKQFMAYDDSLLAAFSAGSLSDSLSSEEYSSYSKNALSEARRSKLLLEAFYWKEIIEVGGGPISFYSMLGYKFDSISYNNSNSDATFGSSYKEANGDLSRAYLATDIFIPALHSLSVSWSARLEGEELNFYQRAFIDYKIAKSLFRFSFSSGQKSPTINEMYVSSFNNEETILDKSLNTTNWISFDVLANKDLKRENFKLFELGYHQSLLSSIDIDVNLWARRIDDAIVRPRMDDYLDYLSDSTVISSQDSTIYHMIVSVVNADYISKKGLDSQLSYSKSFSSSKIIISEKFSYIFEDYIKYKNSSKIDRKSAKNHPIFRESFSISYDTKSYRLSLSEYSSSSTKERYSTSFMKYTRAYSLAAEYKYEQLNVSLFANDFGGERAQIDPSEDSSRRETDEYSLIAGASLGVSLKASF